MGGEITSGEVEKIVSDMAMKRALALGWLCPACGRGNAPTTATCPCKPWPKQEVTC